MSNPTFPTLTTSGATLKLLLEADTLVLNDGDPVSTWADQSGNGKDWTGTGATRPTYKSASWPGSKPCVRFVGSSSTKLVPSTLADWKFLNDGSKWHVWFVWRTNNANTVSLAKMVLLDSENATTANTGFLALYSNASSDPATSRIVNQVGRSSLGNAAISKVLDNVCAPMVVHNNRFSWDGTTQTIADWGVSLGTGALINAFNNANPSFTLTMGITSSGGTLPLDGDVVAVVMTSGGASGLNSTDIAAIDAYLEAKWYTTAGFTSEQLLGTDNVYAVGGSSQSITTVTKYASNPTFESTPANAWDAYKGYLKTLMFSDTDYRKWNKCWTTAAGSLSGPEYETSTDAVTWTKPVLNQVTFGGNTNNNLMHASTDSFDSLLYNASGAAGQKYLMVLEAWFNVTNRTGIRILGSDDGITGWSLVKDVFDHDTTVNSTYLEAKDIQLRSDGLFQVFFAQGHDVDLRSIKSYVSNTSDPTGTWTLQPSIAAFAAAASTAQFYEIKVNQFSAWLWFAAVTRFNSTTNHTWIEMWCSRDQGRSWTQTPNTWIPNGGAGTWDAGVLYSANLLSIGSNWHIEYVGNQALHGSASTDAQHGFATVSQNRLANISGAGSWTTRAVYQPGMQLTVNCDASGGGSLTAALLDASGNAISGYADAQSNTISTNTTGTAITWGSNTTLPSQICRIRLTTTGAGTKVYSLSLAAPSGGPFPHFIRRRQTGGMIAMSGGIA